MRITFFLIPFWLDNFVMPQVLTKNIISAVHQNLHTKCCLVGLLSMGRITRKTSQRFDGKHYKIRQTREKNIIVYDNWNRKKKNPRKLAHLFQPNGTSFNRDSERVNIYIETTFGGLWTNSWNKAFFASKAFVCWRMCMKQFRLLFALNWGKYFTDGYFSFDSRKLHSISKGMLYFLFSRSHPSLKTSKQQTQHLYFTIWMNWLWAATSDPILRVYFRGGSVQLVCFEKKLPFRRLNIPTRCRLLTRFFVSIIW